jgi:predicted HTH transcriptional regulator
LAFFITGANVSHNIISEKLGENHEAIRDNNAVTAVDLNQYLGLTLRAVEKQLAKMKLDGVLRRVGPDKGGYWAIAG